MKKILFRTFLLIIIYSIGSCNAQQKITLSMAISDTTVSCKSDNLKITYTIVNNSNKSIQIPSEIIEMNSSVSDLYYFFDKYDSTLKTFQTYPYLIEMPVYRELKLIDFNPHETVVGTLPIGGCFFKTGYYRVRIKFNLSNFNRGMKDVYSKYVYFKVKEPFDIYLYLGKEKESLRD